MNELYLKEAVEFARDKSSPGFMKEVIAGKQEIFEMEYLQRLLQFVGLEIKKRGIMAEINLTDVGLPIFEQILNEFPPEARDSALVRQTVALIASVHASAIKIIEAIDNAPDSIRVYLLQQRYKVSEMLQEGRPESGNTIMYRKE